MTLLLQNTAVKANRVFDASFLKKRLTELGNLLAGEYRPLRFGDIQNALSVDEEPVDYVEEAMNREAREMTALEIDQRAKRCREIAVAVGAIRDGSYGICSECEAKISSKRLKALPWAVRCITCQTKEEESVSKARKSSRTKRLPLS